MALLNNTSRNIGNIKGRARTRGCRDWRLDLVAGMARANHNKRLSILVFAHTTHKRVELHLLHLTGSIGW